MTNRRPFPVAAALVAAIAAAVVLALPAAADAAARAELVSPSRDAVVDSPVELRVHVDRDVLDQDVTRVEVRLSSDGGGVGSVSLTCVAGCGTTQSVWGGRTYDPAAPFGVGPVCNGRWHLQVAVDGDAVGSPTSVLASAPGAPASDVRVAIQGRDAHLTWRGAPEPDVAAYRVERRTVGGEWREVGTTGGDATSFVDADVDEGEHEWRVVTLRPDGRSGGAPVAPCRDTEPDLATTSATTGGRVTEPRPSPSPTETTGGTEPPTEDPTGSATPDGGTEGPVDAGAVASPAPSETTSPSPSPSTEERTTAPAAPATPAEPERYYGEDQGVGTLDYGDVTPAAGDDEEALAAGEPEGHWVPGGVSVTTESRLDQARLLRPVAGGLILLTFGFHLRRWQREHHV